MTYECHITCYLSDAKIAASVAQQFGWKTSEIARDPLLGDGTYFYLTKHADDYMTLYVEMSVAVVTLLRSDAFVVRQKIEHIVFDTKTGIDLQPAYSHEVVKAIQQKLGLVV